MWVCACMCACACVCEREKWEIVTGDCPRSPAVFVSPLTGHKNVTDLVQDRWTTFKLLLPPLLSSLACEGDDE